MKNTFLIYLLNRDRIRIIIFIHYIIRLSVPSAVPSTPPQSNCTPRTSAKGLKTYPTTSRRMSTAPFRSKLLALRRQNTDSVGGGYLADPQDIRYMGFAFCSILINGRTDGINNL